jgi:Flp pilus assembly protein TadB
LAFLGGVVTPTIAGAKSRRQAAIDKTEAIASWAEQLRDVIGSSAGLQEAISVTADVAPMAIRPDVQQIKYGMLFEDLATLLRRFADRLDDPAADQIVVSLVLATTRSAGNLTDLLDETAASARAEASMRMRAEVARAQSYADAKVATFVVLGMFGFLLVFNAEYLEPYGTFEGQLVLGVVGFLWAAAVQGLAALAKVRRPERVLALVGGNAP